MSKIEYTRDGLRKVIEETHDANIEAKRQEWAELQSEGRYRGELADWRSAAHESVLGLARRIKEGAAEDAELSGFSVPQSPTRPDRYTIKHAESSIKSAISRKERALRVFGMLSEKDTYAFTPNQLRENFGV